ncbi:MAG: polyketide cyclase [Actinomycetia bacterium]|nr:polyketide cyclase [Actinomycetes bacterium]
MAMPEPSAPDLIRQLVARYCVALERRDIDTLVELHDADVDTRSELGRGRDAMRAYYERGMTAIGRSVHLVGTHLIELVDDDHATGVVYSQAHEERTDTGGWVVDTLCYLDDYVRGDGAWHFAARRDIHVWFSDPVDVARRTFPADPALWP